MKKIICSFMMMSQVFIFSSFAADTKVSDTQTKPAEQAVVAAPAAEAPKEVKAEPQAVVKEEPKPVVKEETKEVVKEQPQIADSSIMLREKTSDQNPLRKIARGAVNTTLGWVEIPRQVIRVNRSKGDIAGAFWGPLKGFAYFVRRTAVGVYEVTTFLLPPYKPVVNPEFIFSDDDD